MIKKLTLPILLTGFILLTSIPAARAADGGRIGVVLLDYTLDTTNVELGYTLTLYAQVTNYDTVTFRGLINFGLHNNHENLTSNDVFKKPPYSGDTIILGPGETVPAIFSVNVSPQYFAPGPDVVVVWPICSQPIQDSIIISLRVVDPSAISGPGGSSFSYAVLGDRILLKSLNVQTIFKQVRIYNTIGQLMLENHSDFITEVPLPELAQGIYLCEFTDARGRRTTFRFYH
jgi:hypothetical protein